MPFMERNTQVMQCPDFVNIKARWGKATAGYAYNYTYCGPGVQPDWASGNPFALLGPINSRLPNFRSTNTTVVFADAAAVTVVDRQTYARTLVGLAADFRQPAAIAPRALPRLHSLPRLPPMC